MRCWSATCAPLRYQFYEAKEVQVPDPDADELGVTSPRSTPTSQPSPPGSTSSSPADGTAIARPVRVYPAGFLASSPRRIVPFSAATLDQLLLSHAHPLLSPVW
jgi:hypothetical protein